LLAADLEIIGLFLFGPRWQCAMARAINRSDRLVRSWVAEDRPVSIAASHLIEKLTRDKHGGQMKHQRAAYLDTIASLSCSQTRGRLLAMDLSELQLSEHMRRIALEAAAPALIVDLAKYRRPEQPRPQPDRRRRRTAMAPQPVCAVPGRAVPGRAVVGSAVVGSAD
jgi:hypothetical protein